MAAGPRKMPKTNKPIMAHVRDAMALPLFRSWWGVVAVVVSPPMGASENLPSGDVILFRLMCFWDCKVSDAE